MKRRRTIRTICERQHRWMRRAGLTAAVVLLCAYQSHADTIVQVESALNAGTVIPLGSGVVETLAQNLLTAQADSPYSWESDSLALSITAVLRAISLEATLAGATEIDSAALEPLPFLQSTIAIDDRASLTISPTSIDFGSVPVATPEANSFLFAVVGLVGVGFASHLRRRAQ